MIISKAPVATSSGNRLTEAEENRQIFKNIKSTYHRDGKNQNDGLLV